MKTFISESTVRPVEWDITSSSTAVYHNRDIKELPATEDLPLRYSYTVDQYTFEEYQKYLNEVQSVEMSKIQAQMNALLTGEAIYE